MGSSVVLLNMKLVQAHHINQVQKNIWVCKIVKVAFMSRWCAWWTSYKTKFQLWQNTPWLTMNKKKFVKIRLQ